jgi:hypothetical protein
MENALETRREELVDFVKRFAVANGDETESART